DTRVHLARLEADRRLLEVAGDGALVVGLDDEHALALFGREQRRRRGHRALADPALPGEEQQAPRQEVGRGSHGSDAAEADPLRSLFRVDLDVGQLVEGDADPAALRVGEPDHRVPALDRLVDRLERLLDATVEVEGQLLRRMDDTDADFHGSDPFAVAGPAPAMLAIPLRGSRLEIEAPVVASGGPLL